MHYSTIQLQDQIIMCKALAVFFIIIHTVLSEEIMCTEDYVCEGREGDSIVIPCGPWDGNQWQSQEFTTFTYYNESAKLVLSQNSTEFLKIMNLTLYEDKSKIRCVAMSHGAANFDYLYSISVLYSPKDMTGTKTIPYAHINKPYLLQCPLTSNPQPKCSWSIFKCFGLDIIHNISDYRISYPLEDGCLLYIKKVSILFDAICFGCNATNELGSAQYIFNNLDFIYCSTGRSIIISPQPDEGSTVFHALEGENITIECVGFGFGKVKPVIWEFNGTASESFSTSYDAEPDYDQKLCKKTSYFRVGIVNENTAGVYTCIFDSTKNFEEVEIAVIKPKIYKASEDIHEKDTVWIVCVALIAVFIISIASAFITIIIRKWGTADSQKFQFKKLEGQCSEMEYNFDVFVSFADKDRKVAQEAIKSPLEAIGYNVCWHHDAFVPGLTVNENMESFIFQSKYIIALISRSFFESTFCKKELDIARRKVQKTGENCLIPIMLEKWECIPTELLKITYIDIDDKLLLPRLENILEVPVQAKSKDSDVNSSDSSTGSYISLV